MFSGANSFNQDLCSWGDDFPYTAARHIFYGSGCTFQDTPQLDQRGPFCASLCGGTNVSVSSFPPTLTPSMSPMAGASSTATTTLSSQPTTTPNTSSLKSISREQNKCFADKSELQAAVNKYIDNDDCANNNHCEVGQAYGHPIDTWCVGNITDMSFLFFYASGGNVNILLLDIGNIIT